MSLRRDIIRNRKKQETDKRFPRSTLWIALVWTLTALLVFLILNYQITSYQKQETEWQEQYSNATPEEQVEMNFTHDRMSPLSEHRLERMRIEAAFFLLISCIVLAACVIERVIVWVYGKE